MRNLPAELAEVAERIRDWARGEPEVGPVWLYGSRVRGGHRFDSDLDVALRSARRLTPDEVDDFQSNFRRWTMALSAVTGLLVHIQPRDADQVAQAIDSYGIQVYEP